MPSLSFQPIFKSISNCTSKATSSHRQYRYLHIRNQDNILTVSLNRPEKKNAMSFAMMRELIALAQDLKSDRQVRAVILTGEGSSFCAGIDLGDLSHPKHRAFGLWELVKPWQSMFQRVCLIWRDMPVPVIAAVHGHCIGAGLQLVLAADVRISTPDCQLAILEGKWGLVPDMGLTQAAYGVVRADVLKELAMSARLLDGQQAQSLGLVTHVHDNPIELAEQLAAEFANRSPDAVLASKRVINHMYQQSACTLYQEKMWQLKLMLGENRKLAVKKAKDQAVKFAKRQFG